MYVGINVKCLNINGAFEHINGYFMTEEELTGLHMHCYCMSLNVKLVSIVIRQSNFVVICQNCYCHWSVVSCHSSLLNVMCQNCYCNWLLVNGK